MNTLHYDILDDRRRAVLPHMAFLREQGFYLAGGTALALQIGHRDSIDFDFFRSLPTEHTNELFEDLTHHLAPHVVKKTQEEKNTLGIAVDETVRISCMTFPYPLVEPRLQTEYLDLAGIADIGCMKLNAITSRGAWKDYVDLYFITNMIPLATLLTHVEKKMPTLDPLLALKSLVFFEDLPEEPILYKVAPVTRATIERALTERVRAVSL